MRRRPNHGADGGGDVHRGLLGVQRHHAHCKQAHAAPHPGGARAVRQLVHLLGAPAGLGNWVRGNCRGQLQSPRMAQSTAGLTPSAPRAAGKLRDVRAAGAMLPHDCAGDPVWLGDLRGPVLAQAPGSEGGGQLAGSAHTQYRPGSCGLSQSAAAAGARICLPVYIVPARGGVPGCALGG